MTTRLRPGVKLTRSDRTLLAEGDCPHDCIDGHLPSCDCAAPAWDIGDLICRSACEGCCPVHVPTGLKALEHATGRRARKLIGKL